MSTEQEQHAGSDPALENKTVEPTKMVPIDEPPVAPKAEAADEGIAKNGVAAPPDLPGPGSEPDVEDEKPPMPPLADLGSILSDDTSVFDERPDIKLSTRHEVVKRLMDKHSSFIAKYQLELETGVAVDPSVIADMEDARGKRDDLNKVVATLKEKRTSLKEENKRLRKQFLELLKVQEKLKESSKVIEEHFGFIDRQEYKLMTEGVSLDNERKLMKDIKETMNKIRDLTGCYIPKEVDDELTTLDQQMKENYGQVEDAHQKMLGLVTDSQVHHQRFVDGSKKVRESEARKGWLQRRIALHGEMQKFWETQTGNADAMDASDTGRTTEQIRDRLLKELEEAFKEEEERRKKSRRDQPRQPGPESESGRRDAIADQPKPEEGAPVAPEGSAPDADGPKRLDPEAKAAPEAEGPQGGSS